MTPGERKMFGAEVVTFISSALYDEPYENHPEIWADVLGAVAERFRLVCEENEVGP